MFYSYWHATGLFNPILAYKDFLYLWIHILCMDAWKHGKGYKPKCEHGFLGTEGDLIKLFLFFSFFLCSNHILLVSLKTNYKENRSFSLQKKKKRNDCITGAFPSLQCGRKKSVPEKSWFKCPTAINPPGHSGQVPSFHSSFAIYWSPLNNERAGPWQWRWRKGPWLPRV